MDSFLITLPWLFSGYFVINKSVYLRTASKLLNTQQLATKIITQGTVVVFLTFAIGYAISMLAFRIDILAYIDMFIHRNIKYSDNYLIVFISYIFIMDQLPGLIDENISYKFCNSIEVNSIMEKRKKYRLIRARQLLIFIKSSFRDGKSYRLFKRAKKNIQKTNIQLAQIYPYIFQIYEHRNNPMKRMLYYNYAGMRIGNNSQPLLITYGDKIYFGNIVNITIDENQSSESAVMVVVLKSGYRDKKKQVIFTDISDQVSNYSVIIRENDITSIMPFNFELYKKHILPNIKPAD